MPSVLKLYEASDLDPSAFAGQMLNQQKLDGTVDLRTFNAMIEGVNSDVNAVLERARNSRIKDVRDFAIYFETTTPFSTWEAVKTYDY